LLRGPLVLTFYRGIWCLYCNFDLQALEAARPLIEALGATLIAISQQTPANSRKSQRQNGLGFPILSIASAWLRRSSVCAGTSRTTCRKFINGLAPI
jgi:peroxiredoxin